MRYVALISAVLLAFLPLTAQAKVRQVGPTSFHKQLHLPNSTGKTGAANNDDGYSPDTTRERRQNRRMQRQRAQRDMQANGGEARTASDAAQPSKRKGRRERQHEERLKRLQERQLQKNGRKLSDAAERLLND